MPDIPFNSPLKRTQITGTIRTILLFNWSKYASLGGILFIDAAGNCIYRSAFKSEFSGYSKHEITLDEGEKIIGFQSRENTPGWAHHHDF